MSSIDDTVIRLWLSGQYTTADIARLLRKSEADVERVLHRWRENKRRKQSLPLVDAAAGKSARAAIKLAREARKKALAVDKAMELARSWEANRLSRH